MPHQKTEPISESASRLGRFAGSQREAQKKKKNPVVALQEFAKSEAERKKQEETRKKKQPVNAGPSKGFLRRMYDSYFEKK